jgi:predicted amidophosphoribosyltransferase
VRARAILDFLFPPQCAGCNALGNGLCSACAPANGPIHVRFPALRVTALAPYEGTVRAAVLALKDGRRDVAEALGAIVAPLVARDSALVPIPTTARRKRERGFDGVAAIALVAAHAAGAHAILALQQRVGDAQRGRSRRQRLAARGRFCCDATLVAGRRVTLLDDVCTTGATLQDCAAAVRESGGLVEEALVVAVALHEAGGPAPATKSARPWKEAMFG